MNEPWNIKSDDDRKADTLPTFIIFCEDEVSEPIYFKFFETDKIKVNPIKKQDSKITNVLKAICYCEDNGLMQKINGLLCLGDENTQVWCVYDRDIEDSDEKIRIGNVSFDEAIETARDKGFKVAWSNDAFELWILLHFEDVDVSNPIYKNRISYYNRLTEIFKNLPNPNQDLLDALKHKTFSYKQDLKHENNFRNIVRKEIVNRTNLAVERSKKLEHYFEQLHFSNHEKSPCTLIHHLTDELIRVGGKDICLEL